MLNGKLYDIINDVELPTHASYDPSTKMYQQHTETTPAIVALYWPDGYPCIYAEMYLQDISPRLTIRNDNGGSLGTVAKDLTHLIKYCWKAKKDFQDLDSDDFYEFVTGLREEHLLDNPTRRKRDDNTVNRIIDNCINFLLWLQIHIVPDKVIVGSRINNPQIRLVERNITDYFGKKRTKLVYPFRPTSSTQDRKRPMPSIIRNKLWDAVAALSDPSRLSKRYRKRFEDEKELYAELDYLRTRRELELSLFEATGLRPSEQARLRVNENKDCSDTNKIIIPTMKTRKKRIPKRKIPLEFGVAVKFDLFIKKQREALIARLKGKGIRIDPQDHVFLCSRKGTPLSEDTLEREFHRIVEVAGIVQRACVSMFRHRFITRMVVIHLQAFLKDNSGKTRALMTDSDYRTILKRVAVFTGHRDLNSLLHYIDYAWDEIGVFNYVQPAHDLVNIVDGMANTITSLAAEIKLKPHVSAQQMLDRVLDVLKFNKSRILETINAVKKPKSRRAASAMN